MALGDLMKSADWASIAVGVLFLHAAIPAQAQRAGDNAVTAAQDAFGTTVGNESIGLYSSGSARGFSPIQAGNLRIEGLYFYQPVTGGSQSGLDTHLSRGSTVRVGLTAQSYPFPAPTGIADYQLRLPGEKTVVSVVGNYGQYDTYKAEVDAHLPIIPGKLGVVIGAGGGYDTYSYGGDTSSWAASMLLHWRPTENLELIPFWSRSEKYNWESVAFTAMAGPFFPPKIKRRARYIQGWADGDVGDTNYGVLGRLVAGQNWTLRAGLFRSWNGKPNRHDIFLINTQSDGSATAYASKDAPQTYGAYSGEVRASGRFAEGPRRHTVHLAARGYLIRRTSGGADSRLLGPAMVGVYTPSPEPVFTLGPQGLHKTRQGTPGIAYEGDWAGVGALSAGVQKTFYRRTINDPGRPTAQSHSRPWLYNGTMAVFVTTDLTVYGSYTRGLEESAVAPESAANRGDAVPASITEQVDAGVRYVISPRLKLTAGLFEVKKPYLDRNPANIFTAVGSIKHRGVEVSLSGQPLEGLTMIAGAVLLRARVAGLTVDQGLIGKIPPGSSPRLLRLNLQYGPKSWHGLSADGQVEHKSAQQANRLNTFKKPATNTVNLGGRYQFALFSRPASFRVQVLNVTNEFSWSVNGASGFLTLGDPRRYTARFSVDF